MDSCSYRSICRRYYNFRWRIYSSIPIACTTVTSTSTPKHVHVHATPPSDNTNNKPTVNLIEKGPPATFALGVSGPSGGTSANTPKPTTTSNSSPQAPDNDSSNTQLPQCEFDKFGRIQNNPSTYDSSQAPQIPTVHYGNGSQSTPLPPIRIGNEIGK